MNIRYQLTLFVGLCMVLALLAACSQQTNTQINEQEVAVAVALTQTAAAITAEVPVVIATELPPAATAVSENSADTTATVVVTPAPTSAAPGETSSPEASFPGISFTYDETLTGGAFSSSLIPRVTNGPGPGHGIGAPETIHFNIPQTATTIDIFAVDEYLGLFPDEWEMVDLLQTLLREKPDDPIYKTYPYLPQPNAVQVLHTQPAYLTFQNGAGLRYLTQYAQGPLPIEVTYTFQGLTDDGRYYISMQLPVTTAAVPSISDAAFNDLFQQPEGWPTYRSETLAVLDTLNADDFQPSLTTWDTLVASLRVAPENFPSPGAATAANLSRCHNDADFITDVTIPDNTEIEPEAVFTKTWRVRNSGDCTWSGGHYPTFIEGDPSLLAQSLLISPTEVLPGAEADVSITMQAPFEPGTYYSRWQLQSPGLVTFGDSFYVQIEVPLTEANEPATTIPDYGVIEGGIGYPGDIPAMTVYFYDIIDSDKRFVLQTEAGWDTYRNELPVGQYYVFARPTGESGQIGGGYTQAVLCGLGTNCTDHRLIIVTISEGKATTGIDILDWTAPAGSFPLP